MSPPPSAKGARRRDPEPSEPLGSGPRVKTCSSSCLSWLHPLRSWSLRQTRGGSARNPSALCGVARFSHPEDRAMDWNRVEGNWKEVKGKVKEKWGKLTDDDLTAINGQRDQLEGRLQKRYGYAKDQARKDVDTWFSTLK